MKTTRHPDVLVSFIIAACLYCLPGLSIAEESAIQAQLKLVQMECIQPTEHGKDEIYFDILTIDKDKKHKSVRVPETHPLSVPAAKGTTIKNATLLKHPLAAGESVTLIISLLETDHSNYNPDDFIGVAEVTVRNNNGQIETEWAVPKTNYEPHTTMAQSDNKTEFTMTGDGGDYKLIFDVVAASPSE